MTSDYKSSSVGFYKYHDVILGKGNFATVYLAQHKIIGCEVALKVINTADIEEEYLRKNLDREACILRGLQHPNIIRLYEVIKSSSLYCLSLEAIRGVNLYQYMVNLNSESIPERLARIFFYQMLSGVEYMHRVNVIHRDLKLENILVEFGHIIKIVDFGLSNIYYPTYVLRTHCGSVEYAAPELFKPMSVYGTAADVWSLGVILYAMVVGKMPFKFCQKNNKDDKTPDNQETSHKRDRFVKRVSKGLMQDNWEHMEKLSAECWNLLHEMLQPDQFRRIRIEHAISHLWILKDKNLKKRLPQSRRNLERKYHSEIVYYLALNLNISTSRIERHIKCFPFHKISAMFYIARDILVKEVLHPPKKFESSFLYRFECWRQNRSSLYSIEQNCDYRGKEVYHKYDPVTCEEIVSPKYTSSCSSKVTGDSKISPILNKGKNDANENNLSPRSKYDNQKLREKYPLKISRKFVTFENINVDSNNETLIDDPQQVSRNAYRSYKNSRPKTLALLKCKDKSTDKQSDVKHQTENQSTGENLCENNNKIFQISKENTGDSERLKKLSENNKLYGKRHIIPNSIEPNERISKIVTKSKSSESKPCESNYIEERYCYSEGTQSKTIATSNSIKSFRRKPRETTEECSTSRRDNANPPELVESQGKRNNVSLLTRSYQPSNCLKDKKEDTLKNSELRSRIPIQNFQFGKSSPYYKTLNNAERKISSKRTSVANRMSFCQGDTKE